LFVKREDVMAIIRGGDTVRGGYYWNAQKWDASFVQGDQGVLPGGADEVYRRLPVLGLLLAAPIMGGLFVMFLPFIGVALLLQHIGRAAMQATGEAIDRMMLSLAPSWRPGMAFLAGKAARKRTSGPAQEPSSLDALERDVQERRKQ
jgi:hypothetical protein